MLAVKSNNVAGELGLVWAFSGVAVALVGVGSMALEPGADDAWVFYAAGGTLVLIGLATVVLAGRPASIRAMGTHGGAAPSGSPAKIARMIELAEMQLLALTIERSDINARAMAVLALDGALAAIFVVAEKQIGRHLPLTLGGLALGAAFCLAATRPRPKPEVGPQPTLFLAALAASRDRELDSTLFAYLSADVARNSQSAKASHRSIQNALGITVLVVGYTAYLALLSKNMYGHFHLSLTA